MNLSVQSNSASAGQTDSPTRSSTRRASLQFRVQTFNALNTPHFGSLSGPLGTPAFDVISGAGDARSLQLKLQW